METGASEATKVVHIGHQLAKVVLGSIAAFLAGKAVEGAYDKFVVERNHESTEVA